MSRWERWSLHLLTVGVSVSGLFYYWMKYLLEIDDPFSVLNHPWQAGMLEVHLILSPLLLFLIGLVTSSHISKKLKSGTRQGRRSGILLLSTFPVMALTGYLLQVVSQPLLLVWISGLHVVSGSIFFGLYGVHLVVGWVVTARSLALRSRKRGAGAPA